MVWTDLVKLDGSWSKCVDVLNWFDPVYGSLSRFTDLQKPHGPESLNISMIPTNVCF